MGEALLLRELGERDEGPSSRESLTTLPAHRSTDREGGTFEALSAVVSRASFPDAAGVSFEREGYSSLVGARAARRIEWAVDDGASMHIHSTSELWTHLTTGTLSPLVLVWREGMEAWEPAFRLPELACAIVGFDPERAAEGLTLGGSPQSAGTSGADELGRPYPTFDDLADELVDDSLRTPEPHALGATPAPPSASFGHSADGTPPPESTVRDRRPELRRAGVGGLVGIALGTAFAAMLAVVAAPERPARAESGLLPVLASAAEGARALAVAGEPKHVDDELRVHVSGPVELVSAPAGGESALEPAAEPARGKPDEAYAARRADERGRKRRRAR